MGGGGGGGGGMPVMGLFGVSVMGLFGGVSYGVVWGCQLWGCLGVSVMGLFGGVSYGVFPFEPPSVSIPDITPVYLQSLVPPCQQQGSEKVSSTSEVSRQLGNLNTSLLPCIHSNRQYSPD